MRKNLTLIFLCLCFLCTARNTNVVYNAVYDSLFIEGLCYRNSDSIDLAYSRFLECEKIDPDNAALSFELSKIYTAKSLHLIALEHLNKAYSLDPENYFYAINLADCYEELGNYDGAIKVYKDIYKRFPEKKNTLYLLARCYALNEELDKSIDILDKLEDRIGINKIISVEKSRLYIYDNKPRKAIKVLDELIKKYPIDADLYVLRGDIRMEIKDSEEAIDDYNKALSLDPNSPGAQISLCAYYSGIYDMVNVEYYLKRILSNENIGVAEKKRYIEYALNFYQKYSNYPEIIDEIYQTVIKANPESTEALLMYAQTLKSMYNTEKANEILYSAVLLDEKCIVCWKELIINLLSSDDKVDDHFLNILKQAQENFPNEPYFLYISGLNSFINDSDLETAFATLKKAAENAKNQEELLESIYLSISNINIPEAIEYTREGVRLFPKNLMLVNNYSYHVALLADSDFTEEEYIEYKKTLDEAEKLSEFTVKADAINPYYLDTYGYILFLQKKYNLAKFYLEQALNYDKSKNFEVLEHYGDVLNALGDKDEAIKYWRQAYEISNEKKILNKINQYEK